MCITASDREKNGKTHTSHRVMEKRCLAEGRCVQQRVIYLGELGSEQKESWQRALRVFDPQRGQTQTMTLFAKPEVVPPDQLSGVAIYLNQIKLLRPGVTVTAGWVVNYGASCSWISSGTHA
jgi:hypothetical protein